MNTNENKKISENFIARNFHRIRVFNEEVKISKAKCPKEYCGFMKRYMFDDHKRYLMIENKVIGFMVSPYNINYERHKALDLEGHKVIEMRQYYHPNCETLAVIKEEYLRGSNVCWFWKLFELVEK